MHLEGSDPVIEVLVSRIKSEKLELQPDFQRGEVWSTARKQALIDTILRGWHVPPIHIIVVEETGRHEILDGQQRLTAIRDFVENRFPFDGNCEPKSREMERLDLMFYRDLPEKYQNKFDNYSIRQFLITDYDIGEPGELFHRLNQQARLTPSEKRNAFFGPVRAQVKDLLHFMEEIELDRTVLGFTNSRMAYDDVLSKTLIFLEKGSIRERISEQEVTERYRNREPFSEDLIETVRNVLKTLKLESTLFDSKIKFNKATLTSWLLFLYRNIDEAHDNGVIGRFICDFEHARIMKKKQLMEGSSGIFEIGSESILKDYGSLVGIYNDRATSRVADASSVVLRDGILNLIFSSYRASDGPSSFRMFSESERELLEYFSYGLKRPSEGDHNWITNILVSDWGSWGKYL